MTKSFTTKATVRKSPKTRAAARKASHAHRRQAAPKRATETARGTYRRTARFAGDPQMPESVRAFAERSVAQTREVYEQSLDAVLESWERFIDAAGQGAAALNRSVIDMTRRNVHSSFGLAEHLAGAKNLAEAMEVQTTYWRKQISDLTAQSEEMQRLSTKLTADVAAPLKAQVTRGTRAFLKSR
jgi:phasin family protein